MVGWSCQVLGGGDFARKSLSRRREIAETSRAGFNFAKKNKLLANYNRGVGGET